MRRLRRCSACRMRGGRCRAVRKTCPLSGWPASPSSEVGGHTPPSLRRRRFRQAQDKICPVPRCTAFWRPRKIIAPGGRCAGNASAQRIHCTASSEKAAHIQNVVRNFTTGQPCSAAAMSNSPGERLRYTDVRSQSAGESRHVTLKKVSVGTEISSRRASGSHREPAISAGGVAQKFARLVEPRSISSSPTIGAVRRRFDP